MERPRGKVAGLSRHPQKDDGKGELCLAQFARIRAAVLAGRFFLGVRYFLLMLNASAESRDWVGGCIEYISSSPPPSPSPLPMALVLSQLAVILGLGTRAARFNKPKKLISSAAYYNDQE
jgi:hypothetical protein